LSGVPSAREIYEALASTEMADSFVNRLAAMAHYLNLDQINYILSRERKDLGPALSIRLPYLRELKERVKEVAEHFGGLSYALQPVAISFYLDEATRAAFPGPRIPKPALPGFDLIAGGVLGPKDAAVLLRAGLAAFDGSRIVQINQRMLWDHILCQPPSYLIQVLVEMSENSPRALAAILYGLMEMDQQMLREPMDIASEMEKRLGRKVPHRRDYMAGGSRARDSYFNDLSRLAEAVMEDSSEYRALSSRIEVDYHDVPPPLSLAQLDAETLALYKAFESKVNRADSLGRACTFSAREKKRQTAAKEAYEAAFEAARLLVAREPRAWQLPEVKNFMERNGEALMVLSVVRNYQESIDDVPRWVHVRSGKSTFATEQELLRTVIDVIYYYDDDREVIWDDPLVRLLMDPPEAEYDFTLISCMGVITEGAAGPELSTAYARLAERRGVDVIRADTRTARSLEFNATKVEDAVRRARTPWGFIGYSQGCANGLRGESLLRGGTPEQQQLASTMAGRNLLFSAINGSAHGTCGDAKFLAAMTEGDRILKHYQAVFSGKLIEIFLKGTAKVLDSRMFLQSMGGITSLSHYGVANLAREGQFSPLAPTCYIRGIVEESNLPEALEMLSNVLTKQIGTHEHDTQVEIHEAVGHFVWVHTPHNGSLKECQIDSLVQSTHHWSPLHKATEFVTTQRDLDLAVYDAPKDRHVFPFVDCLARFGIIATR
ncbi:hypothetical protein KJ865_01910, partial [Myxococcota bacterium]|nr:hypothetical protein [Myxococcota bacterium]